MGVPNVVAAGDAFEHGLVSGLILMEYTRLIERWTVPQLRVDTADSDIICYRSAGVKILVVEESEDEVSNLICVGTEAEGHRNAQWTALTAHYAREGDIHSPRPTQ